MLVFVLLGVCVCVRLRAECCSDVSSGVCVLMSLVVVSCVWVMVDSAYIDKRER